MYLHLMGVQRQESSQLKNKEKYDRKNNRVKDCIENDYVNVSTEGFDLEGVYKKILTFRI